MREAHRELPARFWYDEAMLVVFPLKLRLGAVLLVWMVGGGCAAPDSQSYWSRHFDGQIWGGALVEQTERPEKLVPAVGLLALSAGLAWVDSGTQQESLEGPFTEGSTQKGDTAAIGLGVFSAGLALGELAGGDHGHAAEVLLESAILVDGVTEILKHTTSRERPDGSGQDSFPSGHTSFAFSMATFLARRIDDLGDGPLSKVGYLAYIPAAYVGIDRSEADRHWPTDVAFGAFLGLFLTNVVYDAHYGTERHPGIHSPRGAQWSVEPSVGTEVTQVEFVLRF